MIVDSHCHLNFPQYEGVVSQVIENAVKNGVSIMQTICTRKSEFENIYAIAEAYAPVYASVGLHPHDAKSGSDNYFTYEELLNYTSRPKTIGIGETGLDYYYENSPKAEQKESFLIHIKAAQETGLPLIVHTRDAEDDTAEILTKAMAEKPFKLLIHCFTGTSAFAQKMLDIGAYISISGIVTFKKSTDLQDAVQNVIPLDRMLVETDSPFLAPMPFRGKTNEPAHTRLVAEFVADLKGTTLEHVAEVTTANFLALFSKVKAL
jgi:TatD DNase family protein